MLEMEEVNAYHVIFLVLSALRYQPTVRLAKMAIFHRLLYPDNALICALLEKLIILPTEGPVNAHRNVFFVLLLLVIALLVTLLVLFLFWLQLKTLVFQRVFLELMRMPPIGDVLLVLRVTAESVPLLNAHFVITLHICTLAHANLRVLSPPPLLVLIVWLALLVANYVRVGQIFVHSAILHIYSKQLPVFFRVPQGSSVLMLQYALLLARQAMQIYQIFVPKPIPCQTQP